MPDPSKPPSRSDDGDWQDADEFEDVDCVICDGRLTFDECRALMDGWAYYESREDVLARATCERCKRKENGDDE